MTPIVKELIDWTRTNAATLTGRGVRVTEKFPKPHSAYPWKASIGLEYHGILVSFTVWERSILQTELIIVNADSGKTLITDDKTPTDAAFIRADRDGVAQRLVSDTIAM